MNISLHTHHCVRLVIHKDATTTHPIIPPPLSPLLPLLHYHILQKSVFQTIHSKTLSPSLPTLTPFDTLSLLYSSFHIWYFSQLHLPTLLPWWPGCWPAPVYYMLFHKMWSILSSSEKVWNLLIYILFMWNIILADASVKDAANLSTMKTLTYVNLAIMHVTAPLLHLQQMML